MDLIEVSKRLARQINNVFTSDSDQNKCQINENQTKMLSNKRKTNAQPDKLSKATVNKRCKTDAQNNAIILTKPPLPPKVYSPEYIFKSGKQKKCDIENADLIRKLKTNLEQFRLENADLKVTLANEKAAVRSLKYLFEI